MTRQVPGSRGRCAAGCGAAYGRATAMGTWRWNPKLEEWTCGACWDRAAHEQQRKRSRLRPCLVDGTRCTMIECWICRPTRTSTRFSLER